MTTTTYLTHFSLTAAPFTKEVPDGGLWLPSSKQRIVDEVVEAIAERDSVELVGESGAGKTCLLRALRHHMAQTPGIKLTYCHNVTLGRRDFYRQLCIALGLEPSATAAAVFYAVSTHVEGLGRDKLYPVFVLDEAHLLHQDTLDHLHILMNYEWDSRALLSLVLVGLPELHDRLALRRNRSLFSRIHRRLVIEPLGPEDTREYLTMRLKAVSCDRALFTTDAVALLHEAAAGSLRDIDRLATAALRSGARRKRKLVERDDVTHAIDVGGLNGRE